MKRDRTKERIIKAAQECLASQGDERVSMEAVGLHAGVHRRTIYSLFQGREELQKEVMLHCLREMTEVCRKAVEECGTLEEAIIAGTMATIELCRKNRTTQGLSHSDWRLGLARISDDALVSEHFELAWKPAFDRAKRAGEVARNRKFSEFSQWLRGVQYLVLLQEDRSRNEQIKLLRQYIQPGIGSR